MADSKERKKEMIVFDEEVFDKILRDFIKTDEKFLKDVILSYIVYANNSEINEMSEYSDQLSRL